MNKVMIFIARPKGKNYEWLARHNAPNPNHGGDRWYVVTGNLETGETLNQAAAREVQEETGIDTYISLVRLPLIHTYTSKLEPQTQIHEQAYIMITDFSGTIILNEESTEYKWLSLEDFIQRIWWPEDREELKRVLCQATQSKK